MNLSEFRTIIENSRSVDELDAYLLANFRNIRTLFIYPSYDNIIDKSIEIEQVFNRFIRSEPIRSLRSSHASFPDSFLGVFVLFGAIFERVGMHGAITLLLNYLPECSLKYRLQAIVRYKSTNQGYVKIFQDVLLDLDHAQFEDDNDFTNEIIIIVIEYYLHAAKYLQSTNDTLGAVQLKSLFSDCSNRERFSFLGHPLVQNALGLSLCEIEQELFKINNDIVVRLSSEEIKKNHSLNEIFSIPLIQKMPEYIEHKIFDDLEGRYDPRYGEAISNLENDENDNKAYLGTYFPRSFVESYNIMNSLMNIKDLESALFNRNEINILDVGSGTGGNIMGLLECFKDRNLTNSRIRIISVDGNEDALLIQQKIVEEFNEHSEVSVVLETENIVFGLKNDFVTTLNNICHDIGADIDIIMSSKFISEFYHKKYSHYRGLYRAFVETISGYLSPEGICLLLDVTLKRRLPRFIPELMNQELNQYVLLESSQLNYIMPLSCALWHQDCESGCFSQKVYTVTHAKKSCDISNVSYKVLARKAFVDQFVSNLPQSPSFISKWKNEKYTSNVYAAGVCRNGIVGDMLSEDDSQDAFIINTLC